MLSLPPEPLSIFYYLSLNSGVEHSGLEIASGHGQNLVNLVTCQEKLSFHQTVCQRIMRSCSYFRMEESSQSCTDSEHSEQALPSKRRALMVSTVKRWISENDKAVNTADWLTYEVPGWSVVSSLKCSACSKFQDKLRDMRNFKLGFIDGSRNQQISSVKDHASSDMHSRAMLLLKKASLSSVLDYSPIAKALHKLDAAEAMLSKKFEIAHFITKENLSFLKMGPLCELVERQGIDVGQNCKNDKACSMSVHYIAEVQLLDSLSKVKYFRASSQMEVRIQEILRKSCF